MAMAAYGKGPVVREHMLPFIIDRVTVDAPELGGETLQFHRGWALPDPQLVTWPASGTHWPSVTSEFLLRDTRGDYHCPDFED